MPPPCSPPTAPARGVEQSLSVLAGGPLLPKLREQVIEDTLRGAPAAKRAWTERNMIEDITAGLDAVTVPVTVVMGDRDQVEHEPALRKTFARFLPQATFRVLRGIGHLSPLEAPEALGTPAGISESRLMKPRDWQCACSCAVSWRRFCDVKFANIEPE